MTMEYQAKHRYADMSARKIRPFADLIRGKNVDEALELLRFLPEPRGAAARAGAQERPGQRRGPRAPATSTTWSSPSARIDGGPMIKRIMPRARGTAYPIKRRMCHIHVAIGDEAGRGDAETTAAPVAVTTPAAPAPNVTPAPAPAQPVTRRIDG